MLISSRLFNAEKAETRLKRVTPVNSTKRVTADTSAPFSTPKKPRRMSRFAHATSIPDGPWPRCSISGLSYSSIRTTTGCPDRRERFVSNSVNWDTIVGLDNVKPACWAWVFKERAISTSSRSGVSRLTWLKSITTTGCGVHSQRPGSAIHSPSNKQRSVETSRLLPKRRGRARK